MEGGASLLVLMPHDRASSARRSSQVAKHSAFLAESLSALWRKFVRVRDLVSACHQARGYRILHRASMNQRIHHLAVWVLALIHFFIGLGWYALFGEAWLNYNARTMTDIEPPHNAVLFVTAIVSAVLVNYTLAWLFAKMHVAHALTGLKIALICWLGFLFAQYAAISVFSAFETNPWPLILINMGRPFVAFAISGIVLGAWRLREL
jgi:hypothetical protein